MISALSEPTAATAPAVRPGTAPIQLADVTVLHASGAFPSLRPVAEGPGSGLQRVSEAAATEPTVGLLAPIPVIARFPSGAGAPVTAGVQRGAPAVTAASAVASASAVAGASAEPARIVPAAVRPAPAAAAMPSIGLLAAGGLARTNSARSRPAPVPWADAGEIAVAAGVAQREADGSVVFRSASTDQPDEPSVAPTEPTTVERTVPAVPTVSPEATAPTTSAGPTPTAGTPTADLDELARRLYGRLRVMLKHELRLDRERAGLLTASRR